MRRVLRRRTVRAAGIVLGCGAAACASSVGGGDSPVGTLEGGPEIPGLDPDELTARERSDWAAFMSELPAPCPQVDATLKQCVKEHLKCAACVPAARFLFSQVRRGKTAAQLAVAYQIRFAPEAVHNIEIGGSPGKGAKEPIVRIVEWADFECTACAATAPLLDRKTKMFPGYVGLVFKQYPIRRHVNSDRAARAALAAARQGRFWRLHALLYLNQHLFTSDGIRRLARQAGLDMPQFERDWVSPAVSEEIERDRRQADALGLTGTPTLYVNGRHFDYDHFSVLDDLDEWIQLEIEIVTGEWVEPEPVDGYTWPDPAPDAATSEESGS